MTRTKTIVGPTLLALLLAGCMGAPTTPKPTSTPDAASATFASIGIANGALKTTDTCALGVNDAQSAGG